MMYPLKSIKSQLYMLLSILCLSGCCTSGDNEFKQSCPYELEYSGHFLRIPITVSPHQMRYMVGDTIQISTIFSDSIYDLGTRQTFQIQGFPFKPLSLLYRFTSDSSYDSGYRVNELAIESRYGHVYNYSSNYSDSYRAYTTYIGHQYSFESTLILKKPGRYILVFTDLYQDYLGSGNAEFNAEADAITFEGKCPTLQYYLCSMIDSGDDYLEYFEPELVYLDKQVYRDQLRYEKSNASDALHPGGTTVEFSGFFGFEVLE